MKAVNLKTEHMENPLGIDVAKPYLSWTCQGGKRQSAYEIEAISGKSLSGRVVKSIQTRCTPYTEVFQKADRT